MTYDYYVLFALEEKHDFRTFSSWKQANSFAEDMREDGYIAVIARQCAPALEPVAEGDAQTLEDDNAGIYRPATMVPPARVAA